MAQSKVNIHVRSPAEGVSILDLQGELVASAEESLFAAYAAVSSHAKTIMLNFSEVESINSLGAGLLIALVARARKQKKRLLAFGLSNVCRRALELTRLDEVVGIHTDEAEALSSL